MSRREFSIEFHEPVTSDPAFAAILDRLNINPDSILLGSRLELTRFPEGDGWYGTLHIARLIDEETAAGILDDLTLDLAGSLTPAAHEQVAEWSWCDTHHQPTKSTDMCQTAIEEEDAGNDTARCDIIPLCLHTQPEQ